MKYLVFSHFLNRSLPQNNYSLSTVTRWWCFAEELRGTCFLGKTFSVVLGIKTNQLLLTTGTTDDKQVWQKNSKLENWLGLDAAFFGFLEQVSAANDRGQVKRQCGFAL